MVGFKVWRSCAAHGGTIRKSTGDLERQQLLMIPLVPHQATHRPSVGNSLSFSGEALHLQPGTLYIPLKEIEYGFWAFLIRSPHNRYSIYLMGTIYFLMLLS